MYRYHNSSVLAKQVAETLNMTPKEGLVLYKELSQLPDGHIKDALDALLLTVKAVSGDGNEEIEMHEHYPERYTEIIEKIEKHQQKNRMQKYAACIRSCYVRDAQYATQSFTDDDDLHLNEDAWVDADKPLFCEIVEAETMTRAKQIAAAHVGVPEDNIELYPM